MAEELSQNEIIEDAQIQQWVEANVPGEDADQVEEVEVSEEEYAAEEPEVEAAEEPETETRVSRNFARMKQKERELQKQQRELHSEREALRPFKEAQEASSSGDMLGALEKVGWDYNRATDQVFKDGKLAPQAEQQAAPEVQQKLDQLDQYMKKEKMDKYVGAIKDIVDTDENYSLIRAKWAESVPMILQMQQISMNEENRVMDPEELLDKAEAYYENLFQTVVSTEKGRKLYSQIEAGDGTPQDSPSKNPQRTRSRTLRNQVSRPKSKTSKRGPMTEREQLEAAIAAVNWT
jgi:hypothetical protein|tara:strand:- start:69 stop:944 length:876 start_codon:yes stop_codon:yes gene_type:complete